MFPQKQHEVGPTQSMFNIQISWNIKEIQNDCQEVKDTVEWIKVV